jgi:hypothetical protein
MIWSPRLVLLAMYWAWCQEMTRPTKKLLGVRGIVNVVMNSLERELIVVLAMIRQSHDARVDYG